MPFKTTTIPDWTQPQLDAIIAGNPAPLPPAGTLLSNVILPSDWNALPTYFAPYSAVGYVPYTGATADVNLGIYGFSSGYVVSPQITSQNIQIDAPGGYPSVGHILSDTDLGFHISSSALANANFVGVNGLSSTPYFGSDPTATGFGVQYSSNILYVTRDSGLGDAGALSFQNTGGANFYGDSSNYVIPVNIDDACSFDDASTNSFVVQLPNLGRSPIVVPNDGSVLLCTSKHGFYENGSGYVSSGFVAWDSVGRLALTDTPITYASFAKLEVISNSYTQLILGNSYSSYVTLNVGGANDLTVRPNSNSTGVFKVANSGGTALFTVDTSNDRLIGRLGSNDILFAKGASNITPNLSIGASGGKAVALGSGTSGSFFGYDSTGTFAITTDTRANLVGGSSSGGTQRIGMTSAGLVMIGAGTATARLHVTDATANANLFILANTDATFGNSYTFKISNGSGGGLQKNLVITGGASSNDAVLFENTMGVYMGTTVGTNNGVYIGDNNNTNQIPKALLHVGMDIATMPTIDANTGMILSNASATGDSATFSIIAGATGFSTLNFGDTADENVGYIQYGHTTNTITMGVNTAPALYMDSAGVGVGVAANDKFTVGSSVNGTNITLGLRTLTSGGSSMRTIFTQNASTGVLDLVVDQGQNGSARAFNLTVGGATNAIYVTSTGLTNLGMTTGTRQLNVANSMELVGTSPFFLINGTDSATGLPRLQFQDAGVEKASLGIDNSTDTFHIVMGSMVVANSKFALSPAGNITIIAGASLGSSSSKQIFNASTATTVIDYDVNASSTANNTFIRLGNGTLTSASSGVSNIISSTPSINQSGTAGYTALNINVTETATGSGAKNLVKLAVGGTAMFNVDNAGATTIGSGSAAITKVYTATATLDFGSIGSNSTAELTITVTGAATGDTVALGVPSGLEAGLTPSARVSAADTVTIRVHNSSGGAVDPASATWRATIIKF